MRILCNVSREQFQSVDRAGRPYTMQLVHYSNAATGQLIRTRGFILPANSVRIAEPECEQVAPEHSEPIAPRRDLAGILGAFRAVFNQFF